MLNELTYQCIISNPNTSPEQIAKENEYKKYIDNHIENVNKVWETMKLNQSLMKSMAYESGLNLFTFTNAMDAEIEAHDQSKFCVEEWEPYRRHWHPIDDQEKEDSAFDFEKAWEHHYKTNTSHHWNWWAKTNPDNMPFLYVAHMLCDWIGMSMVKGGNAYTWYKSQKDIILGKKQKKWVETYLSRYYNNI